MPKCKKDGCSAPWDPRSHKRYCTHHWQEYKDKQATYHANSLLIPNCDCCGDKLTMTGHLNGNTSCTTCLEQQETDRVAEELMLARQGYAKQRHTELDQAQTVADLKDWIFKYVQF